MEKATIKFNDGTEIKAEVIDELFSLLCQHMTAEELDRLPCVQKINRAAAIRDEISGKEGVRNE